MDKQNKKMSSYLVLPIALILLIVPLIVHMKVVPISASAIPFWKGVSEDYDFFSYYKMVWFLVFTGVAIITLFVKLSANKFEIKKTNLYIPMGVYTLFVILSTLVSSTKDIATTGFVNRYEGMYVLIAYMVILFIVINLLDNEKQLKILFGGILISALAIGIIGMFQYFNMDLFQTGFGKKLMLPVKYWDMAKNLNFQLGPRAAYGTLYHTNYMGSFTAMMFPLSLAICLLASKRNYKIVSGVISALMLLNLVASHSRAGIIGAIVAVILLVLVIARNKVKFNIKYAVGLLCVLVLVAVGVNAASKGDIQSKVTTLYNDSQPAPTVAAGIKEISVDKNLIVVTDANGTLNIGFKAGQVAVTDTDKKKVSFNFDKKTNTITFAQEKYKPYVLRILNYNNNIVIQVERTTMKVNFVVMKDGFKLLDNRGQIMDIKPVATWGFKGNENLGSARGYIWSRSLPLLKNTIITGYGPDTFALHFPQNDYMGKLLAYGDSGIIVDKPHNIYLQAGINTGIISLLALLALFGMYFISSIKVYLNRKFDSLVEVGGVGIFAATCGYLIAGLFNDSTISVAPVFWVLLGIGISINMMLSKKEEI